HGRLEWPEDRSSFLLVAYMTVAAHSGTLVEVMERQAGVSLTTRTTPDSSWSLTPLDMKLGDTGYVRGDEAFVFAARGGGVARVHNALRAAGCRFDHWRVGQTSRVVTGDASVVATPERATVTVGGVAHDVHTGACEWWDATYGAAAVPVATGGEVSGLVVIPGDHARALACARFPVICGADELAAAAAHIDALAKGAFVVELDAARLLPAASTPTEHLVRLFVAYAYAGSRLGTRMMPLVASRAVDDAAVRAVIRAASCPLGRYVAPALLGRGGALAADLRATKARVQEALVARIRVEHDEGASARRRARFSFVVQYGEPELARVYEALLAACDDAGKRAELESGYALRETDEWTTTLSATTGKFLREDQRAALRSIAARERSWCVMQLQMGFGKSSVVVPMLVALYLRSPAILIVFVTQPPHLVAQAARAVGALVAAHPHVDGVPVLVIGAEEMRHLCRNELDLDGDLREKMHNKLVVVLSTTDMQCIVRDCCFIYPAHESIAHIADEVDAESDPMKCEVIVEGDDTRPHYDEGVAGDIGTYYDAACELAIGETPEALARVAALDELCTGGVAAGTRLRNVFATVKENMVYRTHYGMSDVAKKLVAVPYPYAGTPSATKDFSDLDVAVAVLALSIALGMRPGDVARLKVDLRARFSTGAIFRAFEGNPVLMRRYYASQIAMRELRTCSTEKSVAFVDLLGVADTFVGFSGTMGVQIAAPTFGDGDPRAWCSARSAHVIDDEASNDLVDAVIRRARCVPVPAAAPCADRATSAIATIAADMRPGPACIIDGSGEFGAFEDDVGELRKQWAWIEFFGGDGRRVRQPPGGSAPTVLYYSHQNSRGVDSDMPIETTGFVTVSRTKSVRSDIAQAIFRLRGLSLRGRSQSVVLVVTSEREAGEVTGEDILAMLVANEAAYATSAASLQREQHAHAQKAKREDDPAAFVRRVVYTDVVRAAKEQTRVVVAHKTVEGAKTASALRRGFEAACYEKLTGSESSDAELTLANASTKTKISDSLAALGIGLSPMLTIRELTRLEEIRRAFAVNERGLVVLTVVEAWARYAHAPGENYTYFTESGAPMFGPGAAPADVVLGRFLCGDTLSVVEEVGLLGHLASKYKSESELICLRAVFECLFSSRFLRSSCVMLHELGTKPPAEILRGHTAAELTAGMAKGSDALSALLLPILEGALGAALAFGRGRARRTFV
ncbi:MAG: DUF3638 domain-containing protein, partial [Chloroflexota bacterium]